MRWSTCAIIVVCAALSACGDRGPADTAGVAKAAASRTTIATDLAVPWGVAFLPDRDALVAERQSGRILRVSRSGRRKRVVMRIPGVAKAAGEGGLLGLAVSPTYARDGWVYAYFTTRSDNRIARFRLRGALQPILTGLRRGAVHNGGRIAFGPDGKLYAGVGDTGDGELAQDRGSLNGKILRLNPDGSVPSDNPIPGRAVWSYGHRNVQGLSWDANGRLWATEFGQNRVDEINLIRPGRNYGWPNVEGRGSTRGGRYVNPVVTWATGQASPSGSAIVAKTMYVAALQGEAVLRVRLMGTKASKLSSVLRGHGRIRTVVRAPDGTLWVSTSNRDGRGLPRDGDDRIIRLVP
jgi:glucose/arabinose dehydrogenase